MSNLNLDRFLPSISQRREIQVLCFEPVDFAHHMAQALFEQDYDTMKEFARVGEQLYSREQLITGMRLYRDELDRELIKITEEIQKIAQMIAVLGIFDHEPNESQFEEIL